MNARITPALRLMSKSEQLPVDAATFEEWNRAPYPLRVRGGVQHYAWGNTDVIPELLGQANPKHEPFAELWLGAHPDLPAHATIGSGEIALNRLMGAAGPVLLGERAFERFDGAFPFLMKILSATKPLSIQAHPNTEQAESGFARDNHSGLDLDDPKRSYKDDKHKPELISALEDFYALRGFRPLDEVDRTVHDIPELSDLVADRTLTHDGMVKLYVKLMQLPQLEVNRRLIPLMQRLRTANENRKFGKADPEYWAIRADDEFSRDDVKDRGLFSVFLLNLVRLRPGQAMYLPAGEPHSYLEGTGVEIMANSNNVLRGGLTPKRVDVEELLSVLTFKCGKPTVLELESDRGSDTRTRYLTPALEFELSRVQLNSGESDAAGGTRGVQLGIVLDGKLTLNSRGGSNLDLERGQSFLIPYGIPYLMSARETATIFVGSGPG
ncbi:MAG: mannose-6-phosphate isomerase, class I [Gammaproteobacteria bacterium]|nr:mannose-6-phosphate isomerase, class I [Gammaproteobacteria bacterium]